MKRTVPIFTRSFCLAWAFVSLPVEARLTIDPSVAVAEVLIDNDNLSQANRVTRDAITEFSPGVIVKAQGARANLTGEYTLRQRASYVSDDHFSSSHQYRADSKIELIDQHLNVAAGARLGQRTVDPTGPLSLDSSFLTANQANFWTYNAGMDWRNRFSSFSDFDFKYDFSKSKSGYANYGDATVNKIGAHLKSGSYFHRFFWAANYQQSMSEGSASYSRDTKTASGLIGLMLTRQFRTSLEAGYESNPLISAYQPVLRSSGYFATGRADWQINRLLRVRGSAGRHSFGYTYDAGFTWTPTVRSILDLSYGKTYIGKTYNGRLSHRMRRTTLFTQYTENLTDRVIYELESVTTPIVDQNNNPIVDLVTQQPVVFTGYRLVQNEGVFINRRLMGGGDLTLRQNKFSASVFYDRLEFQATNFTDAGYGGEGRWHLSVGHRGEFNVTASRQRNNFGAISRADNVYRGSVGYQHTLSKNVKFSMDYSQLERRSSQSTANQSLKQGRVQVSATF